MSNITLIVLKHLHFMCSILSFAPLHKMSSLYSREFETIKTITITLAWLMVDTVLLSIYFYIWIIDCDPWLIFESECNRYLRFFSTSRTICIYVPI